MHPEIEIILLAQRPDAIPILVDWYFSEWGIKTPGVTESDIVSRLQTHLQDNQLPQTVLAISSTEIMGAAQIKLHEAKQYPEYVHWLGGVFVSPEHRGNSIAPKMINVATEIAMSHNVRTLYLQTEILDGGLYAGLGWERIEQFRYKGVNRLLMKKDLATKPLSNGAIGSLGT